MTPSKSGRRRLWVSIALALILVVAAAWIFFSNGADKKTRFGKPITQDLIQRITIAGTVVPFRKTTIAAPFEGYVRKIFVKIGDTVKPGDPIVSIVQSLQAAEPVFPLRSPFGGLVMQIEKAEGEYVKQGDPKDFIVRIDDLSHLYVFARVPEIDVLKLKYEQEAIIKASAILDHTYKGKVVDISQAARQTDDWQRANVEFNVKIEITDSDARIKPGMSCVLDIISNKKEKVLTLRHEYVYKDNEGPFVFTKKGQKKRIRTGLQNEEMLEVLEGLSEQDEVEQVDFARLVVSG